MTAEVCEELRAGGAGGALQAGGMCPHPVSTPCSAQTNPRGSGHDPAGGHLAEIVARVRGTLRGNAERHGQVSDGSLSPGSREGGGGESYTDVREIHRLPPPLHTR